MQKYRTDPRLQAVHERFALVAIWDDHEFSDDCWADSETYGNGSFANGVGDNVHQPRRRRSANQAWYEFMPADIYFTADAAAGIQNVRIYRELQFGTLAHLVMTDERLYRSDHIIAEAAPHPATGQALGSMGSGYMVPEALLYDTQAQKMAAAQAAGSHPLTPVSILGNTQCAWSAQAAAGAGIAAQGAAAAHTIAFGFIRADVIANRQKSRFVADAGMAQALAPFFTRLLLNADQWDGYNAERKALMQHLRDHGIRNVVALTGDIHAFFAGEVRDDYSALDGGNPVMVDLVTAGVSSDSFFNYLKDAVGSLSQSLATLVHYPLRLPVPGAGTVALSVNLLDYTLGAATPMEAATTGARCAPGFQPKAVAVKARSV